MNLLSGSKSGACAAAVPMPDFDWANTAGFVLPLRRAIAERCEAERLQQFARTMPIDNEKPRSASLSFFFEGGAMNFIEKSAITTNEYWLRVYRSCPNFAQ